MDQGFPRTKVLVFGLPGNLSLDNINFTMPKLTTSENLQIVGQELLVLGIQQIWNPVPGALQRDGEPHVADNMLICL